MITIRQATIEDWGKLRELNQKIFVNNPSFDKDLIVDFALTPQGENFFKEGITRQDGCCLIAEENDHMIGYTNGGAKEIPYRKSKYFEIDNLGIIPELKGKGLGKQLLEAITSWAKDHDYQKIYVNCYAMNKEAIDFYRKNGYENIDICLEKAL